MVLFLSKGEAGFDRGRVVFLYNLLDLKRTMWEGPELEAGKHTIVFDFKSDGPGLGKGGTGVLSVDGQEVARNSMEHTTPITFPEDETFDVGEDTRTGVALLEYRYDVPFKFTGKIDKLTFKLEPEQARDREALAVAAMKKVLVFAAVGEGATGLALLIVPSLVGQLLLGEELSGVAIPVGRVAGMALIAFRNCLLAGSATGRHVDLLRSRHAVSCVPWFRRWVDWRPIMARGCASCSSLGPSQSRLARHQGEIKRSARF